jgi:small subunit ribosomal protein S5
MPRINADTLNLEERVIKTNKVQKTHKGGRTMSWNALVVVGDSEGHVGIGLGKARGVPDAIRKGVEDAKKSIIDVPRVGSTIPHEVIGRAGASMVLLKPASPGTGVVAGGSVRAILEVSGVKDILGKSLGAPNAINTARATIECLKQLRQGEEVAKARGKNLEDLLPKGVLQVLAAQEAQAAPVEVEEAPAEETTSEPEVVAVSEGEASA